VGSFFNLYLFVSSLSGRFRCSTKNSKAKAKEYSNKAKVATHLHQKRSIFTNLDEVKKTKRKCKIPSSKQRNKKVGQFTERCKLSMGEGS